MDRELGPEEWAVLTVLTQEGRRRQDCTASAVALALELPPVVVAAILRGLERDGLALSVVEPSGEATWIATGGLP